MMLFQMVNNVVMTLGEGLDIDDTTLVVMSRDLADAERYDPTKQLSLTLVGDEELNDYEIVYATSRSGTAFTVQRGREDTLAKSWPPGTKVIAAISAGMLEKLAETPTSADQVGYAGGNFGASGTVEETLDDMGDAIIRMMATSDYYEDPNERLSGGILSGYTSLLTSADELRWQAYAARITTNGFGAEKVVTCQIAQPTIIPEAVVCCRSTTAAKMAQFRIKLFNAAQPTNYVEWTSVNLGIPGNNAWTHVYFSLLGWVKGGTPDTILPDRMEIGIKDDGTGPFTLDINFVDLFEQKNSYIGSFIRIQSLADFNKVWAIEKFGFQVSLVIEIEDLVAGTVDIPTLRKAELDGNRVYLTSNQVLSGMTKDQLMVLLFTGVRVSAEADLRPAGFVYPAFYNGPLTLDPTTTIRECVQQAYPRGVGVRSHRSAVELHRYDDPLLTVATLADAEGYLLGSDKRSINIDVSALTNSEIHTLYQQVLTSGNFYISRFGFQNADNIKSGTLNAARLPVVPVNKGGTAGTTAAQARTNLGLEYDTDIPSIGGPWLTPVGVPMPWCSTAPPNGYVFLQGALMSRTSWPKLFAAYGTRFNTGGETSAQFRLPDLRGRVIAGLDNGTERLPGLDVIGQVQGAATVVLTNNNLPDHTHPIGGNSGAGGAHYHNVHYSSVNAGAVAGGVDTLIWKEVAGGSAGISTIFMDPSVDHTHPMPANTGINSSTNVGHSNVQPTMGWNWIARAA